MKPETLSSSGQQVIRVVELEAEVQRLERHNAELETINAGYVASEPEPVAEPRGVIVGDLRQLALWDREAA